MSKGLEALERAKGRNGLPLNENFAPVTEKEIAIIEKELKALEIIKNKNVNVNMFVSICNFRDGFEKYNELILQEDMTGKKEKNLLVQEEYDLLKETLK